MNKEDLNIIKHSIKQFTKKSLPNMMKVAEADFMCKMSRYKKPFSLKNRERLKGKLFKKTVRYGHYIMYRAKNVGKKDITFEYLEFMRIETDKGDVFVSKHPDHYIAIHDHAILRYMQRCNVHTYTQALDSIMGRILRHRSAMSEGYDKKLVMKDDGMLPGNTYTLESGTTCFYFKTFINDGNLKSSYKKICQEIRKDFNRNSY
jgi:hypothetical protein